MQLNEHVFRTYDIRGIVDKDFSSEWVGTLGMACGTYFFQRGITTVVVGYDCRHSSPDYHNFLVQGLLATGVDVISIGMVPTPGLYFAIGHLEQRGGIMITASHNPPDYNGFKIWAGRQTIHGPEIQEIKEIMRKGDFVQGDGLASYQNCMPAYIEDICSRVSFDRSFRVVVDGGNGSGGLICAEVLRRLGAEVIPLFCEPDGDFPNHHPDPVVPENMVKLMAKVRESKADMGIGLDGDADRLGLVDSNGRLLFGDELLSIFARDVVERIPGSTILCDVKCSGRLFDDIKARGGDPLMWITGHSIMKAKMLEIDAPLGGELSGHMFFNEGWHGFDDAIYGSARLLAILSRLDTALVDLPGWPPAFSTPEVHVNCSEAHKPDVIKKVQEAFAQYPLCTIDGARITFPHGWGLVRASNTQPVLVLRFEGSSPEALKEIQDAIEPKVRAWAEER